MHSHLSQNFDANFKFGDSFQWHGIVSSKSRTCILRVCTQVATLILLLRIAFLVEKLAWKVFSALFVAERNQMGLKKPQFTQLFAHVLEKSYKTHKYPVAAKTFSATIWPCFSAGKMVKWVSVDPQVIFSQGFTQHCQELFAAQRCLKFSILKK